MKQTRFRIRFSRLAALGAAFALGFGLVCPKALAAGAPVSVSTGETLIAALASPTASEVTLAADVSTSANLSANKPVDLAGYTWTLSGGTVSVSSAVSGGTLALAGSAVVTVTGSVSGGVRVGENATLLRDTASIGTITGSGTVRVLSSVPGLAAAADAAELVARIDYANGAVDLFSSPTATAGSAFWLLGEPSVNYASPREIASVTTDAGTYVPGGATGTLLMQYAVSYALDGGAADPVKPANPNVYTAEDSFTLSDPVKEGYTFAGWTGAGITEPVTPLTVPAGTSGALLFTAHWTLAGGGGFGGGGSGGGGSGWSGGSISAGVTGAAAASDDTETVSEPDSAASAQGGASVAQQSGSGTRVSQAASGTKVSMSAGSTDGAYAFAAAEAAETPFPWEIAAAGALLCAALALLAMLAKRRSDERMRRLMEKLNIRE